MAFSKVIEVTKTIKDELYTAEREVLIQDSIEEYEAKYGKTGVLKMLQEKEEETHRIDLGNDMIAKVDPEKAPRKARAKTLVLDDDAE